MSEPTPNLVRDLLLVLGFTFLFFAFREVFAWFCKSNHILSTVEYNQQRLLNIEEMIISLTQ